MSLTLDIKKKCPQGGNGKGSCNDGVIQTKKGNLPESAAEYGYCIHTLSAGEKITKLTYGKVELKFSTRWSFQSYRNYSNIKEVTTYYHTKYDGYSDTIEVPLILRILKDKGVSFYENISNGKDNAKWKQISLKKEARNFPSDNKGTIHKDFITKLNSLSCKCHNLHAADVCENTSHTCPCQKATVTVSGGTIYNISAYDMYHYQCNPYVNMVKYRSKPLLYRDSITSSRSKLLKLTRKHAWKIIVYYSDIDKNEEIRRPILMQIPDLDGTAPYFKINYHIDANIWTKYVNFESEISDILHQQRCIVYKPVDMNISEQADYPNSYCKLKNGKCLNDRCNGHINVEPYNTHRIPDDYSAYQHVHNTRELLTITSFKNGPSKINIPVKLPIFDVKEVVVFFASCDKPDGQATKTPLLIYVSDNGGDTHKWYGRTKGGNKWKVESRINEKHPEAASENGTLKNTLDDIRREMNTIQTTDKLLRVAAAVVADGIADVADKKLLGSIADLGITVSGLTAEFGNKILDGTLRLANNGLKTANHLITPLGLKTNSGAMSPSSGDSNSQGLFSSTGLDDPEFLETLKKVLGVGASIVTGSTVLSGMAYWIYKNYKDSWNDLPILSIFKRNSFRDSLRGTTPYA